MIQQLMIFSMSLMLAFNFFILIIRIPLYPVW